MFEYSPVGQHQQAFVLQNTDCPISNGQPICKFSIVVSLISLNRKRSDIRFMKECGENSLEPQLELRASPPKMVLRRQYRQC